MSSDPTSSKAAKQILHLQEQNRLLMAENRVLRDSLAVLAPEAGLETAASGLTSYMNSPASRGNPNNNNNNTTTTEKFLSIEDQMSSILGKMIELIRHDISAQEEEKRRHDYADGGGDDNTDDPNNSRDNNNVMSDRESFLDSLRHVFVDSIHMLSEVMINTEGYWGAAFNDKNDKHPMSWLINKFPVVQSSSGSSNGSSSTPSLDWYPLHWCVLSNSSDLIDVEVLHSHYCSSPESRLKVHEELSPLTLSLSKPAPNMEIVQYLIEQDPMMVRSKSAFDGSLPLFHACAYNVGGTAAVRALHKLHPDATREMDNHGYRAINYAAAMGSEEVLRFLLQADSKSALYCTNSLRMLSAGEGESGGIGNTALHDAAANARTHLVDGDGRSDEELDYGLSIDVMMELFHANPAAIKLPNADGALPLHIAARYGSLSLIQLLHGLYPAAVNVADNEDLLPYEYASGRSRDQVAVLEYLINIGR